MCFFTIADKRDDNDQIRPFPTMHRPIHRNPDYCYAPRHVELGQRSSHQHDQVLPTRDAITQVKPSDLRKASGSTENNEASASIATFDPNHAATAPSKPASHRTAGEEENLSAKTRSNTLRNKQLSSEGQHVRRRALSERSGNATFASWMRPRSPPKAGRRVRFGSENSQGASEGAGSVRRRVDPLALFIEDNEAGSDTASAMDDDVRAWSLPKRGSGGTVPPLRRYASNYKPPTVDDE